MTTSPVEVDGWTVSSDAEARELAARALRGELGALPTDAGRFDGIKRAWKTLQNTPWADAFARAMADGLTDPDRRDAAIFFFGKAPDAAGGEHLLDLVKAARASSVALDAETLSNALNAVGRRMMAGDGDALAFGRADATQPGGPEPYIAALTRADPDWVMAHAEAIVEQHPDAALPILVNLQDSGHDPVPTGVAIARHAKRSASFKKYLPQFIDDAAPIQQAMRKRR
jgi:hypothetical protein